MSLLIDKQTDKMAGLPFICIQNRYFRQGTLVVWYSVNNIANAK